MDQLGFVEPVDRLSKGIIVTCRPCYLQTVRYQLLPSARCTLSIRSARRGRYGGKLVPFGLTSVQRLLQRIEHEVGLHRAADPPADNSPGENLDNEGNVHEACQVETYVKSLTHG